MRSTRLLAVAVMVAGCVSTEVGRAIDRQRVADVVPGITTADDLRKWFGPPLRVTEMADRQVLVWRHIQEAGEFADLVVSVRGGVVVNVGASAPATVPATVP